MARLAMIGGAITVAVAVGAMFYFLIETSARAEAIKTALGAAAFFNCDLTQGQATMLVDHFHQEGATWEASGRAAAKAVRAGCPPIR